LIQYSGRVINIRRYISPDEIPHLSTYLHNSKIKTGIFHNGFFCALGKDSTLSVFDISIADKIRLIGSLKLKAKAKGKGIVSANSCLLVYHDYGFITIKVNDNSAPEILNDFFADDSFNGLVIGNLFYGYSHIYDLDDPSQPVKSTPGTRSDIYNSYSWFIKDNMFYGFQYKNIYISDISDPYEPKDFPKFQASDYWLSNAIIIGNDIITSHYKTLTYYRIENDTNIVFVRTDSVMTDVGYFFDFEDTILHYDYSKFTAYNYAQSGLERISAGVSALNKFGREYNSGRTNFYSSYGSIFKLNTETTDQPTIEHFCCLGCTPNQFVIQDNFLYAYSINSGAEQERGFHVFNIEDPNEPQLTFNLPGTNGRSFRGMLIKDETLYLIKYDSLLVFDLAIPSTPVRTAGLQYPSWIWEMYLLGDYLYLHCDAKLHILDLNNPDSWTDNPINPYADYGHAVYAGQDFCYFSSYGEKNVHILDLHDPANPEQIGLYNKEEDINFITIDGDFIYGIQDDSLLVVFDISDRLYPTIIAKYYCETGAKIQSVHISDDYIIVSGYGEFSYVYVLEKDKITDVADHSDYISALPLTKIYPNPARRGSNITIQSDITQENIIGLKIMDVRGTCFATINTDNISFEKGNLTIPGINLPAGNYYLIMGTSKGQTISKLILQ
jgi:hypothetical protein